MPPIAYSFFEQFIGFGATTTISYLHSGQIYASQPVHPKQLLHDLESTFLSQVFPQ